MRCSGKSKTGKPRVCVKLPTAGQETERAEKTMPGGMVGTVGPADSEDLAAVQQSLLKKKYKVATACKAEDVIVTVQGSGSIISGRPEKGRVTAGKDGVRGSYSGAGIEITSVYRLEISLAKPSGVVTHEFSCVKESGDDPAKRCADALEKWLKLQRQLQ